MENDLENWNTKAKNKMRDQVFNIPGNYYSYDNAKALCSAYGADLANYQQIEDAYKNGGEWCNYGWSADQMALFPTQQATFDNLQKIKGHEQDCGRPGVNGGYIANPQVKFGVNCYGNKTKINQEEDELMKTSSPYPKTMQDIEFQKKNFQILDSQRYYKEDSFDFIVQTLGVYSNKEIVKKACGILYNKFAQLIVDIDQAVFVVLLLII
jgi:hypothetical protein